MGISQMLSELVGMGMSQAKIAKEVGVSQPTIHRAMMHGESISYCVGKKIEVLYAENTASKKAA